IQRITKCTSFKNHVAFLSVPVPVSIYYRYTWVEAFARDQVKSFQDCTDLSHSLNNNPIAIPCEISCKPI
ncbi:hypothetical protein BC833DRAFT_591635, partial [Globomyces pollinis-pini]